jgi:hypothetical protein
MPDDAHSSRSRANASRALSRNRVRRPHSSNGEPAGAGPAETTLSFCRPPVSARAGDRLTGPAARETSAGDAGCAATRLRRGEAQPLIERWRPVSDASAPAAGGQRGRPIRSASSSPPSSAMAWAGWCECGLHPAGLTRNPGGPGLPFPSAEANVRSYKPALMARQAREVSTSPRQGASDRPYRRSRRRACCAPRLPALRGDESRAPVQPLPGASHAIAAIGRTSVLGGRSCRASSARESTPLGTCCGVESERRGRVRTECFVARVPR